MQAILSKFRLGVLDRYLYRQFLGPFVLAVGGFVLIGIIDILMYLMDLAVSRGIPAFVTFRLLVYKLPAIMVIFFPMAVLFAVMLVLVRMAKDNEITVLQSSGIRITRIFVPLLILSALVSSLSYFTNERVVPWTNRVSDALIRHEITKKPPIEVAENVIFKAPGERYFYVKTVHPETSTMEGVFIFEDNVRFPRLTTAQFAHWTDKTWTLRNGATYSVGDDGQLEFYNKFSEMQIHVDALLESFYEQNKTPKEMNSRELKSKILSLSQGGINTKSLEVEYAMKKSIPIACFIFGVIGVAFCLTFVRSGKDWWGVVIAIGAAVLTAGLYLFLVAFCRALANDGHMIPLLGAWLPNMVYALLGFIMILYQSFSR